MKVCILGPITTSSYFGGVAIFDEGLAQGFAENNCSVFLATDQKDASTDLTKRIPVYNISKCSFKSILKQQSPDYIITQLAYAKHLFGIKTKAKKIYFLHAFFKQSYYGLIRSIWAVIYQKILISQCDLVFSNSHFTDMINRDFFCIKSDKVFHVGVSDRFFAQSMRLTHFQKEKNSIFFAGRFVPAKGVDKLIKAAEILVHRNSSFNLYIAGDGPEKNKLEQYVADKNLPIHFIGRMDQPSLAEQYRKADVFVSLDISEPFGIVFCEALLSNCKIVCPPTGGQIEFLNKYPDRIAYVNAHSPESIADGLEALLSKASPDELSLQEKQLYSYNHIASQMIDYFSSIENSRAK